MVCAVRLAEINNDTQTDEQEQAQYALNIERHKLYTKMLLDGATIEENGRKYRLDEHLKNKYVGEFEYFANSDINLIEFFSCGKDLGEFFKSEARTLASIIVG